jgi:hypothetical protein
VWSLAAGALTRMAAVQFARDERIGLTSAARFAGGKFFSFLAAPLLPVSGVLVFWLLCLLLGLVGRIPGVGEVVIGLLGLLPLVFGLLMALLVVGVAAGWPLMVAAISAEGSDAFDGFSRSYSYVYSRPWSYAWLGLLTLGYGCVVIFGVWMIASLLVSLAEWGIASGLGAERTAELFAASPAILEFAPIVEVAAQEVVIPETPAAERPLGTQFMAVWLSTLGLLINGFIYSYFWSALTIVYFLLRYTDDATRLDEVYLLEDDEEDDLLPVVGVADSDQPVIERPPGEIPPGGERTSTSGTQSKS